ncbi:MAG: radical SAM protein [Candidatus Omnitrophica bacterium]|nr:radical SAM protein [Candidatus Omnitrophota bacterium]
MAQKIDVLFVHPRASEKIYQSLSNELSAIEPPIWAGLLANGVRNKGYSVAIIDAEAEGLNLDDTVKGIGAYKPRLVVFVVYGQQPSASTQNMYGVSLLCSALKDAYPEHKVLLVGGHVSALPKRTLTEERADFVAQGEGLYTIEGLMQGDMEDAAHLKKVPGLWYREGEEPVFTFSSQVISQDNLSRELPGMAWDLLPMRKYRAHNWHCFGHVNKRQSYAALYTSLGCPFSCSFCCINAPFGRSSFRYWDPRFMIKEFDTLRNRYGVKNIKIADEMFVLKEAHFMELCRMLVERNYGFNIWAYARIDTVRPAYLDLLKKAGVSWLALGIESGSKHVRDGVSKGRFGRSDIFEVVGRIKDAGINVIGNYIFGLPDDTYETMQETLDMALELNCEMANFYVAMAYPGSKLYDMAIRKGWKLPEGWLGYSQYAYETLPLPTEYLSGGEVLGFRDEAWQTYFTDPRYLNSVERRFGFETLEHIREMTKYTLKRKYAVAVPSKLRTRG